MGKKILNIDIIIGRTIVYQGTAAKVTRTNASIPRLELMGPGTPAKPWNSGTRTETVKEGIRATGGAPSYLHILYKQYGCHLLDTRAVAAQV